MALSDLFLLVIIIILGGLYQRLWFYLRDQRRHDERLLAVLAEIRAALRAAV